MKPDNPPLPKAVFFSVSPCFLYDRWAKYHSEHVGCELWITSGWANWLFNEYNKVHWPHSDSFLSIFLWKVWKSLWNHSSSTDLYTILIKWDLSLPTVIKSWEGKWIKHRPKRPPAEAGEENSILTLWQTVRQTSWAAGVCVCDSERRGQKNQVKPWECEKERRGRRGERWGVWGVILQISSSFPWRNRGHGRPVNRAIVNVAHLPLTGIVTFGIVGQHHGAVVRKVDQVTGLILISNL